METGTNKEIVIYLRLLMINHIPNKKDEFLCVLLADEYPIPEFFSGCSYCK